VVMLVAEHGTKHWAVIAKHLKGRTGKQCRERYDTMFISTLKPHCRHWTVNYSNTAFH